MSENSPTFPMTTGSHAKEVILSLHKLDEETDRRTLSEVSGLGSSVLSNTLPILKELGIVGSRNIWKDKLILSSYGEKLAKYIEEGKDSKAKILFKEELLPKSRVLSESHKILKNNDKIESNDLGHRLAEKFDKEWESPNTYQTVGRSCKHLLNEFGGFDFEMKGKGKKKCGFDSHDELMPAASYEKIMNILEKTSLENEFKISDIKKRGYESSKLQRELNTILDLGLAEYSPNKNSKLELTETGKNLKKANSEKERNEIFRKTVLDYDPAYRVIKLLDKRDEKFSWHDVGEAIDKDAGKNRKDTTLKGYSLKFLTWLKKTNLALSNGEYGEYKLNEKLLPSKTTEGKEDTNYVKSEGKSSKLSDSYLQILEFIKYFADIYLDPSWYENKELKEDMKKTLSQLRNSRDGAPDEIVYDTLENLLESAYEKENKDMMREVAKIGKKLEEKYKEQDVKHSQ